MPASHLRLTLVGGPTMLIEYEEWRFLTDPTFDPPGLYRERPVRFEKTSGPALAADEIGPVDAVLLSHDQHFDNLDHAGRAMLSSAGVVYTTKAGAARLGGNAVGLAPFETVVLTGQGKRDLRITATPARHGPIGIEPLSGDVVGFALGDDRPGDLAYLTGDTVWYEGTAEVARRFSPEVVILFTGAAEPRGRFHMTMGSEDALEAANAFPDAKLVAIHNEGWVHLRESLDQLVDVFEKFGKAARLIPIERGRPLLLPMPRTRTKASA
ncbi:MAG: MBL fold metallo-hydrolase [Rhizobiales bacterium 65-79]|nr:MBL fold metallo-hydrolase [Hyphomicrobiales bacterium]OJU00411.1 MAG: MBL fold metallo-hydrolase [Rhizobiales bacterium 65-79]